MSADCQLAVRYCPVSLLRRRYEPNAQQGARANDHGCHDPCSEQHGSRQPRSWLILNVRQKRHVISLMDKAYKGDIPRHKKALVALKREFSRIPPATDWSKLRIEPMLDHVASLERLLRSLKFSREIARLRKGVGMFHSDL